MNTYYSFGMANFVLATVRKNKLHVPACGQKC